MRWWGRWHFLGLHPSRLKQTEGIEQFNQAIVQRDQVTQQNAALVEDAAGAAESLPGQAVNLAHPYLQP